MTTNYSYLNVIVILQTHTLTHTQSMSGPAVWSHNMILVWESGWFWWCEAGRGSIIAAQFGPSAAVRCVYSGF